MFNGYPFLSLYCSYTFTNRLANVRRIPNRKERQGNVTASKVSVAGTLHDLHVRKGSKGCDDFYATLSLLRINGESRQKYIRVSIIKNPGEYYANFMPATYEVYV